MKAITNDRLTLFYAKTNEIEEVTPAELQSQWRVSTTAVTSVTGTAVTGEPAAASSTVTGGGTAAVLAVTAVAGAGAGASSTVLGAGSVHTTLEKEED